MVEVKYAFAQKEKTKRGHDPDDAQHGGYSEHQAHVPCLGFVRVVNVVIRDGKDGSVVEHGDHNNHHCGDRVEVKNQDRQRHEEQHAQRFGDAVHGIAVHPLEDAAAFLDRINDYG